MNFLRKICKIAIAIISILRDWIVCLWLLPRTTRVLSNHWFADKKLALTFLFEGHFLTFFSSCASSTTSVKDKDNEHLSSTIFLCKLFFWLRSLLKGIGYDGGGGGLLMVGRLSCCCIIRLYFSYYSNTFWFNGESRTIWSVHNDCQIVFRNNEVQEVDTRSAEEKFVLGLRLLESTAAAFKVLCSSWHPAACTFLPLLNSMMMF